MVINLEIFKKVYLTVITMFAIYLLSQIVTLHASLNVHTYTPSVQLKIEGNIPSDTTGCTWTGQTWINPEGQTWDGNNWK